MSARVVEKHKTCAVTSLTCVRYARASVRSPGVYVRTSLRTYLRTHTYVRTDCAVVRTYAYGVRTYARSKMYLRTCVPMYLRPYVRAFVRTHVHL